MVYVSSYTFMHCDRIKVFLSSWSSSSSEIWLCWQPVQHGSHILFLPLVQAIKTSQALWRLKLILCVIRELKFARVLKVWGIKIWDYWRLSLSLSCKVFIFKFLSKDSRFYFHLQGQGIIFKVEWIQRMMQEMSLWFYFDQDNFVACKCKYLFAWDLKIGFVVRKWRDMDTLLDSIHKRCLKLSNESKGV